MVVLQQDVGCAGSEGERERDSGDQKPDMGGHRWEGLVLCLPHTQLAGERNPEPKQAVLSQLKPAGSLLSLSALRHIPATYCSRSASDLWLQLLFVGLY